MYRFQHKHIFIIQIWSALNFTSAVRRQSTWLCWLFKGNIIYEYWENSSVPASVGNSITGTFGELKCWTILPFVFVLTYCPKLPAILQGCESRIRRSAPIAPISYIPRYHHAVQGLPKNSTWLTRGTPPWYPFYTMVVHHTVGTEKQNTIYIWSGSGLPGFLIN